MARQTLLALPQTLITCELFDLLNEFHLLLSFAVSVHLRLVAPPRQPVNDSPPIRFASPELARKIASIHGTQVQTITVKMIGKKDVAEYLEKVQAARAVRPSRTFRTRNERNEIREIVQV